MRDSRRDNPNMSHPLFVPDPITRHGLHDETRNTILIGSVRDERRFPLQPLKDVDAPEDEIRITREIITMHDEHVADVKEMRPPIRWIVLELCTHDLTKSGGKTIKISNVMATGILSPKRPPGKPSTGDDDSRSQPIRLPVQKTPVMIKPHIFRISDFPIMPCDPINRRHLIIADVEFGNIVSDIVAERAGYLRIKRSAALDRTVNLPIGITRRQFARRMLKNEYSNIHVLYYNK